MVKGYIGLTLMKTLVLKVCYMVFPRHGPYWCVKFNPRSLWPKAGKRGRHKSSVGLILGIVGALWAGAKVFRMGLLMYGKRPSVSEILCALRERDSGWSRQRQSNILLQDTPK